MYIYNTAIVMDMRPDAGDTSNSSQFNGNDNKQNVNPGFLMDLKFIAINKGNSLNSICNNKSCTNINIITKKNIAISKTFYEKFYNKTTVGLLYSPNNPFDCYCNELLDYNFSLKIILFKLFVIFLVVVVSGFLTPIYIALENDYPPCFGASIVSFLMCVVFVILYNCSCCSIDACCVESGIDNINGHNDYDDDEPKTYDHEKRLNFRKKYNVNVVYNARVKEIEDIIKVFNDNECQWYKNDICSNGYYDYKSLSHDSKLVLKQNRFDNRHRTATVGEN